MDVNDNGAYFTVTPNWTRVSVSTTSSNTWRFFDIGDPPAGSYYIWGYQLEQGTFNSAFATSYIPTTTAAVTRAADVIRAPVGAWYNQPEGTLYSEFRNEYNRSTASSAGAGVELYAAGQQHMFALNSRRDGATTRNGSLVLFGNTAGTTIYVTGTTGTVNNIVDPSRYYKFAGAMASGNSAFTYDGLNPGSLTTTLIPPVPTMFGIGTNLFYYDPFVGHIKNIRYYPARIQNAQLKSLTQ